jgi:hypothetical protein
MSKVRVLVGTRKGAFILTSDGKREHWDVSGPHFAGWEIYHLKGSPVDPNRLYASQSSGTLATLRLDVPVFETVEDLRWKGPRSSFEDYCRRMRSPDLLARVRRQTQ